MNTTQSMFLNRKSSHVFRDLYKLKSKEFENVFFLKKKTYEKEQNRTKTKKHKHSILCELFKIFCMECVNIICEFKHSNNKIYLCVSY